MDNEARKIARHHLGDALTTLMRGGPHGDDWIVFACHGTTEASARAPTVAEAAADCASQLRAGGWVPSHARLEWRRNQLCLMLGADVAFPAMTVVCLRTDVAVLIHPTVEPWKHCTDIATARAFIAEWCAANLHSLHLPPFPETPDAS